MNSENMFVLKQALLFYKLEMYHNELYRLDVSGRFQFMLRVHVYKCLHGIAPKMVNSSCVQRLEDSLMQHIQRRQPMGEERSRTLVHQHGTHCPATLKTAA